MQISSIGCSSQTAADSMSKHQCREREAVLFNTVATAMLMILNKFVLILRIQASLPGYSEKPARFYIILLRAFRKTVKKQQMTGIEK